MFSGKIAVMSCTVTGCFVPGCNGGGNGAGTSARTLYQRVGMSACVSVNRVGVLTVVSSTNGNASVQHQGQEGQTRGSPSMRWRFDHAERRLHGSGMFSSLNGTALMDAGVAK